MSLVHESLVGVLNRRFVSCHFNAFAGPGHDEKAAEFCRSGIAAGKPGPRYGALYTPDGKMVSSFGYDRDEFFRELRRVLAAQPELAWRTPAEKRAFAAADAETADVQACVDAARIATELLDFEAARNYARRALAAARTPADRARARYWQGHVELLDLERKDAAAARAALAGIQDAPADLADDIALDLAELDVRLAPRRGFFPGWVLRDGVDAAARVRELETWIERAPDSNRIGQMHFFLGMARMAAGDAEGADAIWQQHWERYPDDRWALLSRVHHTGYRFSPHGGGRNVVTGEDVSTDPELGERVREAAERGGLEIRGLDGVSPELAKKLREQLLRQLGRKKDAEKEQDEPADDDAEGKQQDDAEKPVEEPAEKPPGRDPGGDEPATPPRD